jgi:hypothetical protein
VYAKSRTAFLSHVYLDDVELSFNLIFGLSMTYVELGLKPIFGQSEDPQREINATPTCLDPPTSIYQAKLLPRNRPVPA